VSLMAEERTGTGRRNACEKLEVGEFTRSRIRSSQTKRLPSPAATLAHRRIRSSKGARCDASFPLISLVRGDGRGQVLLGESDSEQRVRGGQVRTLAFWESRSGVRDGVLDLRA
jgi:hypothetical protein